MFLVFRPNSPQTPITGPDIVNPDPNETSRPNVRDLTLPEPDDNPLLETPGSYSPQKLKNYVDEKEKLIYNIYRSLRKMPIDSEPLKKDLVKLKTLRDSHNFGNRRC